MKICVIPQNKSNKRYAELYGERDIIFQKDTKGEALIFFQ